MLKALWMRCIGSVVPADDVTGNALDGLQSQAMRVAAPVQLLVIIAPVRVYEHHRVRHPH